MGYHSFTKKELDGVEETTNLRESTLYFQIKESMVRFIVYEDPLSWEDRRSKKDKERRIF